VGGSHQHLWALARLAPATILAPGATPLGRHARPQAVRHAPRPSRTPPGRPALPGCPGGSGVDRAYTQQGRARSARGGVAAHGAGGGVVRMWGGEASEGERGNAVAQYRAESRPECLPPLIRSSSSPRIIKYDGKSGYRGSDARPVERGAKGAEAKERAGPEAHERTLQLPPP
jgi:hypothetical protein